MRFSPPNFIRIVVIVAGMGPVNLLPGCSSSGNGGSEALAGGAGLSGNLAVGGSAGLGGGVAPGGNEGLGGSAALAGSVGLGGDSGLGGSAGFGGSNSLGTAPSNIERWRSMKFGIFSHYAWWGNSGTVNIHGVSPTSIDDSANSFDAVQYANDVATAGAEYVVFTAWHGNMRPMFDSRTMKKYFPNVERPQRDVVGDLIDAVKAKGIRVYLYTHPYQPLTANMTVHNDFINELYAETVDRYGTRIDGLWVDENFVGGGQDAYIDYPRLERTIHTHGPDLVTMQNWQGDIYSMDMSVLENIDWWNAGESRPRYQYLNGSQGPTKISVEDMIRTTVLQAGCNEEGGGVHFSIDAVGLGGLCETERIFAAGKLINSLARSIKNTYPSTSYPTRFSGAAASYDALTWGVATRSTNDAEEYIHVLKAPPGKTLSLPAPADGKLFGAARLVSSGSPVTLSQTSNGVQLTLHDPDTWGAVDTAIELDVASPGGAGLTNDTSPSITYNGDSWKYESNRNLREYGNDRHVATTTGDSLTFTFTGTKVKYIASRGADRGPVDFYVDGVLESTVDLSLGSGSRQTAFVKDGLARGSHQLKAVKRGGSSMDVDCFEVTEMINDTDPELVFESAVHQDHTGASFGPSGNLWQGGPGGSWITPQAGDYFEYAFSGTGVEVFASSYHGSGSLVFSLDGVVTKTAIVSTPQTPGVSVLRLTGLGNGTHLLKGVSVPTNADGFIPALYGFNYTPPAIWSYQAKRGQGEVNDDVHIATLRGATATLNFNGTGVELLSTRDQNASTVDYTLDGQMVPLNNYGGKLEPQSVVFSRKYLAPGNHTLTAYKRGGTYLVLDAARIYK